MLSPSTSLSGAFAALRAEIAATQGPAWVPEAIHALIIALFARILDRLEHLLHLWQTNRLPAPAPARQPAPRAPGPRRPPSRRHRYRATPRRPAPARPEPAPAEARPAHAPWPPRPRPRAAASRVPNPAPIRPARDPPHPEPTLRRAASSHAVIVTVS